MARLDPLLQAMRSQGNTDLHLAAGAPPRVRARGELEPLPLPSMAAADLDAAVRELLSEEHRAEFEEHRDVEFTYALPGVARFRASYFLTAQGPSAVFRLVPENAIPLAQLTLPPAFEPLLERRAGLIVVAVPRGSGRSTLMASIVDHLNGTSARTIVSLEDPVELLHRPKKGVVVQREVGRDTASYADGIRAALRSDAEVLVVGDVPDVSTAQLALRASEGGRLVLTFPAIPGAARTLERLVDDFPVEEQAEARRILADNLLGVLSQVLLRRKDGPSRVAAHELLLTGPDLIASLREGELGQVQAVLDTASGEGGQRAMDDALEQLLQAGAIAREEAHRKATDKSRFA